MYKREWAVTPGKKWSKVQSERGKGSDKWTTVTGDGKET